MSNRERITFWIVILLLVMAIPITMIICLDTGHREARKLRAELEYKNTLLEEIGFDVELNDCPNCESEVMVSMTNNFFYIECEECDTYCGYYPYESKDKLFERWNSGNINEEE